MLRYLTAGESHGRSLVAIVEGMPSGLNIEASDIDKDLARRQGGYGRGARMAIEKDKVMLNSGVRHGQTLGSPVSLIVANRDARRALPLKRQGRRLRDQGRGMPTLPVYSSTPGAMQGIFWSAQAQERPLSGSP